MLSRTLKLNHEDSAVLGYDLTWRRDAFVSTSLFGTASLVFISKCDHSVRCTRFHMRGRIGGPLRQSIRLLCDSLDSLCLSKCRVCITVFECRVFVRLRLNMFGTTCSSLRHQVTSDKSPERIRFHEKDTQFLLCGFQRFYRRTLFNATDRSELRLPRRRRLV
jgi:hypothetical protein